MESEDNAYICDDDESSGADCSVDDDFEENIVMLKNYSMISTSADGAVFEMHRLVQLATRKWLEAHGQLEFWKQRFIEILHNAFQTGDFETWSLCQPLFSRVQSAVTQRPNTEDMLQKWANLLHRAAWFAYTKGDFIESEKMAVLARKTTKRLFGPRDEQTVDSLEMTGLVYRLGGRWKDAESLQLQVTETRKQVLGPEHPHTMTSMASLASTYRNQGRWKEAEELYLQVIETRKQVLGPKHPDTLTSMTNLASTYQDQGRWDEAERLNAQVMETRKQVLGPEHPDTLTSMNNLAHTFRLSGQHIAALQLMVECVQVHGLKLGPDHPYTIPSKSALNEWRGRVVTPSCQLTEPPTDTKDASILGSSTKSMPDGHPKRSIFLHLFGRK